MIFFPTNQFPAQIFDQLSARNYMAGKSKPAKNGSRLVKSSFAVELSGNVQFPDLHLTYEADEVTRFRLEKFYCSKHCGTRPLLSKNI